MLRRVKCELHVGYGEPVRTTFKSTNIAYHHNKPREIDISTSHFKSDDSDNSFTFPVTVNGKTMSTIIEIEASPKCSFQMLKLWVTHESIKKMEGMAMNHKFQVYGTQI